MIDQQDFKEELDNDFQERKNHIDSILKYWLEVEQFDLPECHVEGDKEGVSYAVEKFEEHIQNLYTAVQKDATEINDKSRLTIMFQCHRAGYINNPDLEKPHANKDNDYANNPNMQIPRTFLVAHQFIPFWSAEHQQLTWRLSEESGDMIINKATIRTIFRHCPPRAAENQRFSQWLEIRIDELKNLFVAYFKDMPAIGVDTSSLKKILVNLNRDIAYTFWADKQSQSFMKRYCASIDSHHAMPIEAEDQPAFLKEVHLSPYQAQGNKNAQYPEGEGLMTFRWRFNFQKEQDDNKQLGPFFVRDLEYCLNQLKQQELSGLSMPLQRYLSGRVKQCLLPQATNQGRFYQPFTSTIPLGRWAADPNYGLSLMQTVAVNIALNGKEPIVSVNGPPGTGKTTLLKDIIASHVVMRTQALENILDKEDDKDYLGDESIQEIILAHSIVVASSNNKAVENISKELPAKSKDSTQWQLKHFSRVAQRDDWGLFCAVLGNSNNRKEFKKQLQSLENFLQYRKDIFKLNLLISKLKSLDSAEISSSMREMVCFWREFNLIPVLIKDIQLCKAAKDYADFFEPFMSALLGLQEGKLSLDKFILAIEQQDENQFARMFEAMDTFKKQWFGKKLYEVHYQEKIQQGRQRYQQAKENLIVGLRQSNAGYMADISFWGMDENEQLTSEMAYQMKEESGEDEYQEFEARLQLKSPYSNAAINAARTELFCASMQLNELIAEKLTSNITTQIWTDLKSLIDGDLKSNEDYPYHAKLWSLLFLFFPVMSTSLSSVENQFKLMKKKAGFGVGIIDEAGQAVNYHVVGLMQRCRQMFLVGDPIQLEPVVGIPYDLDISMVKDYLSISMTYGQARWADNYLVSASSAQTLADLAGSYMSTIGDRQVGIPLYVHRRCQEPMFSIANKIAYDNKMVYATRDNADGEENRLVSGWIHTAEETVKGKGYYNLTEAEAALAVIEHLAKNKPHMLAGGVFIITPFTQMKKAMIKAWKSRAAQAENDWMYQAFGKTHEGKALEDFVNSHIGTVHTFQGKEASTVILCMAASKIRGKEGGIKWVNSKPNLVNVAVTRAKQYLFVIGNANDWQNGTISTHLLNEGMCYYKGMDDFSRGKTATYRVAFDFGMG